MAEDDESTRKLIAPFISKLGNLCLTTTDGVEALHKMKRNKIDAVVTGTKILNMNGMTRRLKSE